jgi:hypothetical protein
MPAPCRPGAVGAGVEGPRRGGGGGLHRGRRPRPHDLGRMAHTCLPVEPTSTPPLDREVGDDVQAVPALPGGALAGGGREPVGDGVPSHHQPGPPLVGHLEPGRPAGVPQRVGGQLVGDEDSPLDSLLRAGGAAAGEHPAHVPTDVDQLTQAGQLPGGADVWSAGDGGARPGCGGTEGRHGELVSSRSGAVVVGPPVPGPRADRVMGRTRRVVGSRHRRVRGG